MQELDKIINDIKKQQSHDIQSSVPFPTDVKTRLDLLLFIINRGEKPNEGLLQYKENGQLYESYWDIVFALGLIDTFPITDDFRMYNGKIETLTNIDNEHEFMNKPLIYLQSKKINEGNKSGASDITFMYKNHKLGADIDKCSADPTLQPTASCKREEKKSDVDKQGRPQFYFCSSKYYKSDQKKGVDKFDIQNIYTAAKNLHQEYDRKIILLVKDKSMVEDKLRKALRKYIAEEASYVYGMTDLFSALTGLYDYVWSKRSTGDKITIDVLTTILQLEELPKPILRLRLHQYIATNTICDAINNFKKNRGSNKFLVGIVPRGGKTFIAGGIIDKLHPQRVVVLLGAKSETLSQFKKDLFEAFQNFNDYEIIDVKDEDKDVKINPSKKHIFIMSVELYKKENNTRAILKELKEGKHRADLFICDEAHLKQTTEKATKEMKRGSVAVQEEEEEEEVSDEQEESELKEVDKQIQADVPIVYMTGTYMKPLKAFRIPDENVVLWDYEDIQQAKQLASNEDYFIETYGHYYNDALHTCFSYGQTYDSIAKQYQQFPELYLLTTQFTPDAKAAFLKQSQGGFPTLSHLFEVRRDFDPITTDPARWYTGFTNPKGILRLLNYLAPPTQSIANMEGEQIEPISSVLKSIDHIAQRIGDRLGFFTSEFVTHSQLWFLPHMHGHPLYKRMCALVGAIFQLPWFRKYFHVIAVSSSAHEHFKSIPGSENNSIQIKTADDSCGLFSWACPSSGTKSLKDCIIDQEVAARQKGKGLIILAQNMLHLGISLPCVDIVTLLDNGDKIDERIQKMYRALTESTNKKGGYIIDMNYFRTVTAIMNYQITAEKSRKGKKEIYEHEIPRLFNKVLDIFSIDDDKPIFGTHDERASGTSEIQKTIPELQKLMKLSTKKSGDGTKLENIGAVLNRNIANVIDKTYNASYADFLGKMKAEKGKIGIRAHDAGISAAKRASSKQQKLPAGSVVPLIHNMSQDEQRLAYRDMFETVLKLGAFGTNVLTLPLLEEKLRNDVDFRQDVYDTVLKRGAIQENKYTTDELINTIILPNLHKIISEGRDASYSTMREIVNDDTRYPADVETVLTYIKDNLTPKDAERHKHGEVFTPMELVQEMLDTLPENVWDDKHLKWLDPANGMGNYPIAVFLRLFYGFRTKDGKYIGITKEGEGQYHPGLSKVIPNENTRRKHIVQHMLFMVELNSKNNAVAKRLFMKLAPGVTPNIIQMHKKDGFLADVDMKFHNGTVNTFDVVMGNPPYQSGAAKGKSTDKTRKMRDDMDVKQDKHKNLWIPFIKKVLTNNLKKDGFLLFINPIGWFKPDRTGIHEEMLKYQIRYMRIYDIYQSMKKFSGKGKISTAYFLLENKPSYTTTIIVDSIGKKEVIQLNNKSIIILANNLIFSKIQKKASLFYESDELKVTSIKSDNCSAGSNKQIHRISESGEISFIKTSIEHKDQHKPKLYLSGYQNPRFYYDKDGVYGLIGSHQHYFIGNELDKLEDYFKTKLSAILLKHIKYDQEFIEPKYYPDVRNLPLKKITDETLADHFGFTKEERAAINATEYPKREYKFKESTCAEIKNEKEPTEGGAFNKTRKNRRS